MKKVIDRGKRSKTLSNVKIVENISKNPQSFLEIIPVKKEVLPFGLNEDNPLNIYYQNQLSHPSLSHIQLELQESLIQGKIHIQ